MKKEKITPSAWDYQCCGTVWESLGKFVGHRKMPPHNNTTREANIIWIKHRRKIFGADPNLMIRELMKKSTRDSMHDKATRKYYEYSKLYYYENNPWYSHKIKKQQRMITLINNWNSSKS